MIVFSQTVLALMGFSRYFPSSLDLLNSVVQECRGKPSRMPPPGLEPAMLADSLESGTPGIWKSGIQKIQWNINDQNEKFVLPQMSTRSRLAGEENNGSIWVNFISMFFMDRKHASHFLIPLGGPMGGACCYPPLAGKKLSCRCVGLIV